MKKPVIKIFLFYMILVALFLVTNNSYAATFGNDITKHDDTYIVAYGKEIDVQLSNGESILSENSNIARIKENKIQVIGVGHFSVIVKTESSEKKVNFFAWNTYLKKGKYYIFSNIESTKKAGTLKAKIYLAVSETEKTKVYKIEDYFFTTGSYSKSNSLIGKYIKGYYNKEKNKSTSSNYQYSFKEEFDSNSNENVNTLEREHVIKLKTISDSNIDQSDFLEEIASNGLIPKSNSSSSSQGYSGTYTIRGKRYKIFNQRKFKIKWAGSTIAKGGCGPTAVAIVASSFNDNVNPKIIARNMKARTLKDVACVLYSCCKFYRYNIKTTYYYKITDKMIKEYGEKLVEEDVEDYIQRGLKDGPVIVLVRKSTNKKVNQKKYTSSGHFMVILEVNNDIVKIADPDGGKIKQDRLTNLVRNYMINVKHGNGDGSGFVYIKK